MITTAAELWTDWVNSNLLRPKDYDVDIANLVRGAVGDPSLSDAALPVAMTSAGWDARDLIRAIMPVITSFSGMLSDLLSLYERIDATRTHKDNLRISYGFQNGNPIDEKLSAFREKVQLTQEVIRKIDVFRFDLDYAWASPLIERVTELGRDPRHFAENLLGLGEARNWPFASPIPTPLIEDQSLRDLATFHRQVISAALEKFSELGPDMAAARDAVGRSGVDDSLAGFVSDTWWLREIGLLNLIPDSFAELPIDRRNQLMLKQRRWLERPSAAKSTSAANTAGSSPIGGDGSA